MRRFLLVVLGAVVFSSVSGQDKVKLKKAVSDTIQTDVFSGNTPFGGSVCAIYLELTHCTYCDMGTYSFSAKPHGGKSKTHAFVKGEWTVLKGSAKDENATVVELDGKGWTRYYLRHKNGNLQQLDSLLREIKPVKNYMLLRQ